MEIFLTTTLPYANSKPHIGHMFEFVLGDALTRYFKIGGNEVFFNTGLDCHGTKIKEQADLEGISPIEFVDKQAIVWKEFCQLFHIEYDRFYKTSSTEHYEESSKVWKKLVESGDIYKKPYTGLYCKGCESFKVFKELSDGKCSDHPNIQIEEVNEENYFFKLGKYKTDLLSWLESEDGKYFLEPENKMEELKKLIQNVEDISVSRLASKTPWAIPVPGDPD